MGSKAKQKLESRRSKQCNFSKSATLDLSKPLTEDDATCKLCSDRLFEPVTFPCFHSVCLNCFNTFIRETSLHCPFCRYRLSVWSRKAFKEKSLINLELQQKVQEQFQNGDSDVGIGSMGGSDAGEQEEFFVRDGVVAKPGEVKQDLESLLSPHLKDLEIQRKKEEEASQPILEQLKAEEEERIRKEAEMRAKQEEEDFKLAQALAEELAKPDVPSPLAISTRSGLCLKPKDKLGNGRSGTSAKRSSKTGSAPTSSSKRLRPSTSVSPVARSSKGETQQSIRSFLSSSQSQTPPHSSQKSARASESQEFSQGSSTSSFFALRSPTSATSKFGLLNSSSNEISSSPNSTLQVTSSRPSLASPKPSTSKSFSEVFSRQYSSSPAEAQRPTWLSYVKIPRRDSGSQDGCDNDYDSDSSENVPTVDVDSEEEDQESILNAILSQSRQDEEDRKLALSLQAELNSVS